MPALELNGTRAGRFRVFARAQAPLLIATVFITAEGFLAAPELATAGPAVVGLVIVLAASIGFAVFPWERHPIHWLISIALADVVGVALLRAAYIPEISAVGLLTVFPVLWLSYGFGRRSLVIAVISAFFISSMPFILEGSLPGTPLAWANVVTVPILVTLIALAVREAARQLHASRRKVLDANEHLTASLARARSAELLSQNIVDTINVAIAFYDADRKLVFSNKLAADAAASAGFSLTDDMPAGALVFRDDNATPIPDAEQVVPRAFESESMQHEMEWIGPPGHQIAILSSSRRIRHEDGSLWGTLIAAYDVTEMARSLLVRDEFIATVSHELRTPLTSILGYVELLIDDADDAIEAAGSGTATATPTATAGSDPVQTRALLEVIERNAKKLEARVAELLAVADKETRLRLADADVAKLVRRTAADMDTRARDARIAITVDAPSSLSARVDPRRLEQVIENLISNAIKYTPVDGRVDVVLTPEEDRFVLEVRDSGVGMTPDEVEQAFTSFYRADSARRGAVQGIGIGLSVVRQIVEAHSGAVEITSAPGEGTALAVTMPRHPAVALRPTPAHALQR